MDQKALKILFDTYWEPSGWKQKSSTPSKDFEYAKRMGAMFDPVVLSHDDAVKKIMILKHKISLRDVSAAFIASLSSRSLELRSTLGSFAVARHFPSHVHEQTPYDWYCSICRGANRGEVDLNLFNFERYKWGGTRHQDPVYCAFDLEEFLRLEKPRPTSRDFLLMNRLLTSIRKLSKNAKPRDIEKVFSRIVTSNKAERETVINILGICGILETKDHKGFFDRFINDVERALPPVHKIDWAYPVAWWRGSSGINEKALRYYFPYTQIK